MYVVGVTRVRQEDSSDHDGILYNVHEDKVIQIEATAEIPLTPVVSL